MRDLRIVFMGTPDFAVGILQKLVEANKNIVGVITAPDKPAGRGRKLMQSAVKKYALSQGLEILQPPNLKDEGFINQLKSLNANLQIIVAFRMLPKVVWAMPDYGTFNLHASLLPKYRGAAPINWAIINSETETGVTTFFIDENIDTGEIIAKSNIEIETDETVGTLHDKLMDLGSDLVIHTIELIAQDTIKTKVQSTNATTKEAPKLTSENTRIDWTSTAEEIDAFIRGLSPYPVAWSILENNGVEIKVKVYKASVEKESHTLGIGEILTTKKKIRVAITGGYLDIKEIQLAGKRKMEVSALLNGYSFDNSAKLL
ncbi:MAG: methionyl-tRNA formyltransferase [Sediminicola sp.]|jgi:methionyl-tRNA formyltransferase